MNGAAHLDSPVLLDLMKLLQMASETAVHSSIAIPPVFQASMSSPSWKIIEEIKSI